MAISTSWGAILPEGHDITRLKLDLMLGRAVRYFNEAAFPGIGGVFFVRQLTWSALGLELAEKADEIPMRVAEAIEALACWIALFRTNLYKESGRIQGKRKLDEERGFSYMVLRQRSNYVTQPFRMGTTAALVGLELAQGSPRLFNSLELTPAGHSLARLVLEQKTVGDWLLENWIGASSVPKKIPEAVKRALLPGSDETDSQGASTKEKKLIRDLLQKNSIRKDMIKAMQTLKAQPGKKGGLGTTEGNQKLLDGVTNNSQKNNLLAAFAFEEMRAAALTVVSSIAAQVKTSAVKLNEVSKNGQLVKHLQFLQDRCENLTKSMRVAGMGKGDAPEDASKFCSEQEAIDIQSRIRDLTKRLPGVLECSGDLIAKGHLFREDLVLDDEETSEALPIVAEDENSLAPTPSRLVRAYHLMQDVQWANLDIQ
jgi:hypothetical protein